MKKLIALMLALTLTMCLCACGGPADSDTPETTTTAPQKELTAQEKKEAALNCVDKSVEDLYALIGQPESSDYAPSCLNPDGGAEDGELYYDGFTVYTYKTADNETVVDVE